MKKILFGNLIKDHDKILVQTGIDMLDLYYLGIMKSKEITHAKNNYRF